MSLLAAIIGIIAASLLGYWLAQKLLQKKADEIEKLYGNLLPDDKFELRK